MLQFSPERADKGGTLADGPDDDGTLTDIPDAGETLVEGPDAGGALAGPSVARRRGRAPGPTRRKRSIA